MVPRSLCANTSDEKSRQRTNLVRIRPPYTPGIADPAISNRLEAVYISLFYGTTGYVWLTTAFLLAIIKHGSLGEANSPCNHRNCCLSLPHISIHARPAGSAGPIRGA